MPFTAICEGQRITALDPDKFLWAEIKARNSEGVFECPECGANLIAKAGTSKVRAHFAHRPDADSDCGLAQKGAAHLYIQSIVMDICKAFSPELEVRIDSEYGKYQVADILFIDLKKIIEIQLEHQPLIDYRNRSLFYEVHGYDTLWLTWRTPKFIDQTAEIYIFDEYGKTRKDEVLGSIKPDHSNFQLTCPFGYWKHDRRYFGVTTHNQVIPCPEFLKAFLSKAPDRDANRRECEFETGYDWRTDPHYTEDAIRQRMARTREIVKRNDPKHRNR